jgi:prophage endopeptidase
VITQAIRYWREIGLILIITALWLSFERWRNMKASLEIANLRVLQAERQIKEWQAVRQIEQQAAINDQAASADYQKGKKDGNKELDNAITGLRTSLRLREQQLASVKQNLPAASSSPLGCDATPRSDFLVTYGEDALRLAAEADNVVRQLTACQAILKQDRYMPKAAGADSD